MHEQMEILILMHACTEMPCLVGPHYSLFNCLLQYCPGTNSILAGLNGARPTTGVIARNDYICPTTTLHTIPLLVTLGS